MPPAVTRFDGDAPPKTARHGALRRVSIERERRVDGSELVRWPAHVVALQFGPAERDAPTDRVVPNVVDWLPIWAEAHPGKIMLSEADPHGNRTEVDYGGAWAAVQAISHALLKLGAACKRAHPVLAVLSGNSLHQALLTFAALHVGWTVAPITPAYVAAGKRSERLALAFDTLTPDYIYCESADVAATALDHLDIPHAARLDGRRIAEWAAMTPDAKALEAIAHAHQVAHGECVAKVMFTSGSTGMPKGVEMTHAMLAAAQATSAANLSTPPEADQVYVDWLPWHHVMGGNIVLNRLLRFGGTLYIDSGRPAPGKFAETVRILRDIAPTFYFSVPLGYALLVSELERDDALAARFFSRLEYLSFGGASLSASLIGRLQALAERHVGYALPITSGYGATETTGPGLSTTWDMESGGALGLPAPGITVKLQPLGDRYELYLRGGNIASRYLGGMDTQLDAEGYLRTGDAVTWVDPSDPLQGLAFAGRVAEEFKLLSGTWVNVGSLRQRVVEVLAPLVSDAVITGHDRTFVGALLFMNERAVRERFPDAVCHKREELARFGPLLEWVSAGLSRLDGGSSMRVARAMLMTEDPVAEAFEITDKGYINQRAVLQRRAALVDALHADTPAAFVVRLDC